MADYYPLQGLDGKAGSSEMKDGFAVVTGLLVVVLVIITLGKECASRANAEVLHLQKCWEVDLSYSAPAGQYGILVQGYKINGVVCEKP